MNREQLIVELTKLNPNESREDVEDELVPLIDQYAERVALEARIEELSAAVTALVQAGSSTRFVITLHEMKDRFAQLKAQQEEV